MKKFVAVAGNIGVGKSTLVSMLCNRLGWQPFFEPVGENPYLADFYRDMRLWSFHSQIFFLTRRLRSHRQLLDHPTSAIQDRCVYEDAEVFAQNLFLQGLMDERDYLSYRELYRVLSEFLPPPDLVVYSARFGGHPEAAHLASRPRLRTHHHPRIPWTVECIVRRVDCQFQPVPGAHRPRRCAGLCRPSGSPGFSRPKGRGKTDRQGRGRLLSR